jgi:hypothetical protein
MINNPSALFGVLLPFPLVFLFWYPRFLPFCSSFFFTLLPGQPLWSLSFRLPSPCRLLVPFTFIAAFQMKK